MKQGVSCPAEFRFRALAAPVTRKSSRAPKGWIAVPHDGCNIAVVPKAERASFLETFRFATRGVDLAAPNCD